MTRIIFLSVRHLCIRNLDALNLKKIVLQFKKRGYLCSAQQGWNKITLTEILVRVQLRAPFNPSVP